MQLNELKENVNNSYSYKYKSIATRVAHSISTLNKDAGIEVNKLNIDELKTLALAMLENETQALRDDIDLLLIQKEQIDRALEKKSEMLQNSKCEVFDVLEDEFSKDEDAISKLHQVKLQSIDLYDYLSDMVESVIIIALEKTQDGEIKETTQEAIKEITYESIKEGSLNTIRIRKILATILQSSIDISEATPTKAYDILHATLKGMRSGLIKSIHRFKKRIEFMPMEAKHILIEDYDTIMSDLNQTDVLFTQVLKTKADENTPQTKKIILEISQSMNYDLEELLNISKEAADVMKERFSTFAKTAVKKADTAMKSQKAQDAKRMGIQAWDVAKNAMEATIKSAKDAIDKK